MCLYGDKNGCECHFMTLIGVQLPSKRQEIKFS